MLRLLIGIRARQAWNRVVRGKRRSLRVLGTVVGTSFGIAFMAIVGFNTSLVVERVARVDADAARGALPALLIGTTLLALVTSMGVAFHPVHGGDQELLMKAPGSTARPGRAEGGRNVARATRRVPADCGTDRLRAGAAPAADHVLAVTVALTLTVVAATVGAGVTLLFSRVRFGASLLGISRLVTVLLLVPAGVLGIPALGGGRSRALPTLSPDDIQNVAATLRELGPPPAWAPTTWAMHVLLFDDSAPLSASTASRGRAGADAAQLGLWAWIRRKLEHVTLPGAHGGSRFRFGRGGLPFAGPLVSMLQKDMRMLVRDHAGAQPADRIGRVGRATAGAVGGQRSRAGVCQPKRFWVRPCRTWRTLRVVSMARRRLRTRAQPGGARPDRVYSTLLAKLAGSMVLVLRITWLATLVLASGTVERARSRWRWRRGWRLAVRRQGWWRSADGRLRNGQSSAAGGLLWDADHLGLSAVFFVSNTLLLVWVLLRSQVGCAAVRRAYAGARPGSRRALIVDRGARGLDTTGRAATRQLGGG